MFKKIAKTTPTKYKEQADSYTYWHYYYYLKTCLCEATGNYSDMIFYGLKGFEYFDQLPIDHQSSKLAMISQVVHGYNLNKQYTASIEYLPLLEELNGAENNKDLFNRSRQNNNTISACTRHIVDACRAWGRVGTTIPLCVRGN